MRAVMGFVDRPRTLFAFVNESKHGANGLDEIRNPRKIARKRSVAIYGEPHKRRCWGYFIKSLFTFDGNA